MSKQLMTSKKIPPNIHILGLTFAFFATGTMLYMIAMVCGIWLVPNAVERNIENMPAVWTLTHLFVLGWATMIAMGASFQLMQVILRTSLYSRLLGIIHFVVYSLGVFSLTGSFYVSFFQGIFFGGVLVNLGVVLYAYNLIATFVKKKEWNHFIFGVSLSLLNLLITVGLGLMMIVNFAFQSMPFHYENIFIAHIWFGIIGWISGLIITYSFKILPMFYNSPRKAVQEAYIILGLFHAGVWLYVISQWAKLEMVTGIAKFLILVSLAIFVRFVHEVRSHGRKKNPGGAVSIAYLLIYITFGLTTFWVIVSTFLPDNHISHLLAETIIIFLILGSFAATILSYLSKIIPFLWWAYRFHTKWKKKSKMLLSDMTPDKKLTNLLSIYLIGITLVCAAFLFTHSTLSLIGLITASLSALFYIVELLKVFRF